MARSSTRYERPLVKTASDCVEGVDGVCLVVDVARRWDMATKELLLDFAEVAAENQSRFMVVLNKADLLIGNKDMLEEKLGYIKEDVEHVLFHTGQIDHRGLEGAEHQVLFLTSAKYNNGINTLRSALLSCAKPGSW